MNSKTVKKKIVLACSMEEESMENFERLKEHGNFKDYEWHFIHIYPVEFLINYQSPSVYPDETHKRAISKTIEASLLEFKNKLIPDSKDFVIKCLFSPDPVQDMVRYLKDGQVELVAVATRPHAGIMGLFRSSFAEAMSRFSPCDVLVLRPL